MGEYDIPFDIQLWDFPTLIGRKDNRNRMIKVKARGNESAEQMLKRFKKLCEKEGLTKDVKRNSYYEKPSERRRRRARKSMKRTG
jgi:small subunit ribosomal protein S21